MDRDSDDQSGSYENYASDEGSVDSSDLDEAEIFERDLPRVRNNDPDVKYLSCGCDYIPVNNIVRNMTTEELEDIGRDISNNTYLMKLSIFVGALDDERLSSLFRGLSRSSSIVTLNLGDNEFSGAGLRSLKPFVQSSINLRQLNVNYNDIETEGFNILWQALCGSSLERLDCSDCGITSIEIETVPPNLLELELSGNDIQSEGFNRLLRSLHDSNVDVLHYDICEIESIEIDIDSLPKSLNSPRFQQNQFKWMS